MVLVNVIRRFINTVPMQKNITQNDESVVTYRFQISRQYQNLDLGIPGWEWSIAWKNSLDVPDVLLVGSSADESKVYVDWTPKWPETASEGLFEFQIRAKKDDEASGQLLQWNSQVAHLDFNRSVGLGKIDRAILEEYLDKFMQLCSTATIDAEERRAMAEELRLAQSIEDLDTAINAQLQIISDSIDRLAQELDDFDTKTISHYEEIQEDLGTVSSEDSLDTALAKLQWQISNFEYSGVLPVDHGGTGQTSFESGVIYSEGQSFPLKSATGTAGQVLMMYGGRPAFRKLSTQDLSDEPSLLKFTPLKVVDFRIPVYGD